MAHSNSDQDPAGQERLVEEVTQKLGILEGAKKDKGPGRGSLGAKAWVMKESLELGGLNVV